MMVIYEETSDIWVNVSIFSARALSTSLVFIMVMNIYITHTVDACPCAACAMNVTFIVVTVLPERACDGLLFQTTDHFVYFCSAQSDPEHCVDFIVTSTQSHVHTHLYRVQSSRGRTGVETAGTYCL